MKNPTLLFTSFLLVTLAQNLANPAQAATNWLQRVAGTYEGKIWSAGVLIPTTTKFTFNADGSVTGTYEADEGGLIIPGTISECKPVKGRTISCVWDDFYGKGGASFTFNAKYSKFEGHWTEGQSKTKYPWRGSR
ncbi:hypothetical protein [Merismopedia glauca]|uniref:Uncharacterized protein n=1 Tax=Merismopedia glauca CCAP 1448/3 TaxID=1296344 RepID=A0A2T1C1A6_9CYAN|nr:hypothetical protein [Merismopedia glauca]PSB02056.1 hypothetical protein C7B64_14985 [Merismopedia glauca CCAP 1448/3]